MDKGVGTFCEKKQKPEKMKPYRFGICLAEKKIEIECFFPKTQNLCKGYLSHFTTPDVFIKVTPNELQWESVKVDKGLVDDLGVHDPRIALNIGFADTESFVVLRKIADAMLQYNIILMHGVAIAVDGKCYIFTAPSGTGKTTHARNWLKKIPGTIIVNGDKPFIDVDKRIVYGTPWCGKEGMNTNTAVSLAGIIALERGNDNSIHPVSFKEMLPVLLQQSYLPKNRLEALKNMQVIGKLRDIPLYKLRCNMAEESAEVAYEGLNNGLPVVSS